MKLRLDETTAQAVLQALQGHESPEIVAVCRTIEIELSRCLMEFHPGVLVPPGTKQRNRARCSLPNGHSGDHEFPP